MEGRWKEGREKVEGRMGGGVGGRSGDRWAAGDRWGGTMEDRWGGGLQGCGRAAGALATR